ncbi:MAG: hypothetical protein KatS3mg105_3783 [Gemmatales bacterium]|nr:MAG: hypothetical protein KatS3mg105_3783 [Gemmatales bacterium]
MRTWFLVFAGLFVSGVWQAAPAADKPNFIVLLADDQRADSISALGNSVIKTPNIDSLFETGFRFSQAYCMGSMGGAVCVPSRAMLNSGRYLFQRKNELVERPPSA